MAVSKKQKYAFVRNEDAPVLPPPASQAGSTGWLWQNIFASMADYSSLGASIGSLMVAFLSVFILYFGGIQIYGLIDFAIFSAVWSDPQVIKREACWTVEQGGALPSGWHGACWPFVMAKHKFIQDSLLKLGIKLNVYNKDYCNYPFNILKCLYISTN